MGHTYEGQDMYGIAPIVLLFLARRCHDWWEAL